MAFDGFTPAAHGEGRLDLVALAEHHRRRGRALWAGPDEPEEPRTTSAGEALAALFDDLALSEIRAEEGHPLEGRFVDYPAFFTTLAKQRTFSPSPRSTHRRLKILGLLEARLLSVDRVVLGGLDEGTWPPRTETDAFLNRPMRARVGLAPPERRIGQTAHDFVQALGCPDVVITRAQKRDGSPMVPSRFLQRLKAFVGEEAWERMVTAGERYRRLARILDTPAPAPPLPRPAPKPDPALFPRTSRVTEIETLVRDPYSIFARHILKLDALEPSRARPSAAERGTIIHDVLGALRAKPIRRPCRPMRWRICWRAAHEAFAPIADGLPGTLCGMVAALPAPRHRIRGLGAGAPAGPRGGLCRALGRAADPAPRRQRLHAARPRRPDRAAARRRLHDHRFQDRPAAGRQEVFAGFSPQLTLEAVMLMKGAFKGLPAGAETPDLLYIHTSGGREPIDPRQIEPGRGEETRSVAEIVAEHRRRFEGMIARYARARRPTVAALPEICAALLGLRSPRAGQGMVARERRRAARASE